MNADLLVSDFECEKLVLGTLMIERNALAEVAEFLDEDCFYNEHNRQVYLAIRRCEEKGNAPDIITVMGELKSMQSMVSMTEVAHIASNTTYLNLTQHALRLKELAARRSLWVLGQQLIQVGASEVKAMEAVRSEVETAVEKAFFSSASKGLYTLTDAIREVFKTMSDNQIKGTAVTGTPTGFSAIDKKGGLQPTDLIIVAGETSMGKALRMDEPILTPTGWVLNKDLKVGDAVCSVDGKESHVVGIYPQGVKDFYEITFSDGRKAQCSGDHLWEVGAVTFKSGPRVLSTTQIKAYQENHVAFHNRMYIPYFCGEYGEKKNFVIHPYVLGVLIGDGSLTKGAHFSSADEFVAEKVRSLCPLKVNEHDYNLTAKEYYIVSSKGKENPYLTELRRLDMIHVAKDKFIPEEYKTCCREQRLQLLNGLLDTDGYIDTNGQINYSTVSERLAEDVQDLVRSLGYRCSMSSHKSAYNGKVYPDHYRLTICGENEEELFTLPRRKARVKKRKRTTLIIHNVKYIGKKECQCIKVSHPRELFVMSDYVVTHNTSLSINMSYHACSVGKKILFFSMEMMRTQIAARIMASHSGVSANAILYNGNLSQDQFNAVDNAQAGIVGDNMFFDDSSTSNIESIIASIRSMKAKENIDGVVIDYLQILNVNQRSSSPEQAMGDACRRLKNLAKELKIFIIALSQLSRNKENPEPSRSRLRSSGQIEEAADVIILVYRPEYYGRPFPGEFAAEPTANRAMIDVAKGRNIGTFRFICNFNHETATFSDIDSSQPIPPFISESMPYTPPAIARNDVRVEESLPF